MEAAAVEHWTKKSLPSSGMATSDPERTCCLSPLAIVVILIFRSGAVERILHFLSNTPPGVPTFFPCPH